jgi:hypothetical protein
MLVEMPALPLRSESLDRLLLAVVDTLERGLLSPTVRRWMEREKFVCPFNVWRRNAGLKVH